MNFFLQFGHGMKQMSIDLAKKWGEATVILSPRDIKPDQLAQWSPSFLKNNVHTLFDPQMYYPHSNNPNLMKYRFWNTHVTTIANTSSHIDMEKILNSIIKYNQDAQTENIILPSPLIPYDGNISLWLEKWTKISKEIISVANIKGLNNSYYTLALPANILLNEESIIEEILFQIEKFDIKGFYIIAETPNRQYLVEEPLWLSNITQLCAGLKLDGRKVIMGYGNHQMLCLSCTGIDAIASGNFLNVRSFANKFEKTEEIKRKTNWYYNPMALPEYKISFLDVAYSEKMMQAMLPPKNMFSDFIAPLFNTKLKPSDIYISETDLFKHYLHCLYVQCKELTKTSFDESITSNELLLSNAEKRIAMLEKNAIFAQTRSFRDLIDVSKSVLIRLQEKRGFALAREWNNF